MLSKEEKKELLKLVKSKRLKRDSRKLSELNKQISPDGYLRFLSAYSRIFESERLQEYRDLRFKKLSQAKKFLF